MFQCNNVPRLTVREFADQICRRAREVDPDLIGTGLQRMDSDGKRIRTMIKVLVKSRSEISRIVANANEEIHTSSKCNVNELHKQLTTLSQSQSWR